MMASATSAASILRHLPTAILAVDPARAIVYANLAAGEFLGRTPSALRGVDAVAALGGSHELAHAIAATHTDGEERRLRLTLDLAGRPCEVGLTLSASAGPSDGVALILSFRALEARRRIDDRVLQLERLASAGRLAAGLAHQLRNPLAAISALAENLAAEMDPNDSRSEHTTRILGQVARIERIVRSCLELDRTAPTSRDRWSVEVLGRAARDGVATTDGVSPTVSLGAALGEVEVCGEEIIECLRLLLENALETGNDASKVCLTMAMERRGAGAFATFTVDDGGPGMPRAHLDRLFEPFFAVKPGQSGLGLATAQVLAVRNGGTLQATGQGDATQLVLRLRAVPAREGRS